MDLTLNNLQRLIYHKTQTNKQTKWWLIQQSASGLNRGLSSNFYWLLSANHEKFTEECVMFTEKHVFSQTIFTYGLNMNLPL